MDKSVNDNYKEYFKTICEISPVGLFRTDNNGNIVYINKRYENLIGSKLETLKGDGWINFIYEEDIDKVLCEWKKSIDNRNKFTLEFRFKKTNGEIIWVLGQATPINTTNGFVGTITNINKRKKLVSELLALKEIK